MLLTLSGSGEWIRTTDTAGMNRMLWPTELHRHIYYGQVLYYCSMHLLFRQEALKIILSADYLFQYYLQSLVLSKKPLS
jgi:hypothetical protein